MKILLINPAITIYGEDVTSPQIRPPLGLLYIAAVCEQQGHEVKLLDCMAASMNHVEILPDGGNRYGLRRENMVKSVGEFAPDVVGISAMFTAFSQDAFDAARVAKEWNPSLPVILGGMHASTSPKEVLQDKNVDFAVLGEGELTIVELLAAIAENKSYSEVKGLAYRGTTGDILFTPPRERIQDLDSLPKPARHLIDMQFYSSVAEHEPDNYIMKHPYTTIYTSRGCPGQCIYCAAHNVWHHRWIARSAEDVLNEIEDLVTTYGIKEIHFLDDNASVNRERFMALCRGIIERKLQISWACPTGLAIWTLDEEVFKLMKQAGCYKVCFGIESGHPDTQKFIRKKLNLARAKELIRTASGLGFWIQSTFIIGFPYETAEQIEASIDYALSSYSDFVNFLLLCPYPGTEVYELMRKEELIPLQAWNYRNFGYMMSGFRTLCGNKNLTADQLADYFNEAFRRLLQTRIKRVLRHPSILLKKIYSYDSLRFFLRVLWNSFSVAKVIIFQSVTRAGTLKPVYSSGMVRKD